MSLVDLYEMSCRNYRDEILRLKERIVELEALLQRIIEATDHYYIGTELYELMQAVKEKNK